MVFTLRCRSSAIVLVSLPCPIISKISYSRVDKDSINEVLRGEVSAVEAYQQALDTVKEDPEVNRLQEFLADHQSAVSYWKKQVNDQGVVVEASSGPWGTAVEAFVGTAKLFGNNPALKALRRGEEYGLNEYEKLTRDGHLSPTQTSYVRDVLIPNQLRHINSIDAMMRLQ